MYFVTVSPLSLRMNGKHVLYEGTQTNFTCLSVGSRPPVDIKWLVNDNFVNASSVEEILLEDGTYDVRSVLQFEPDRIHNKRLITCRTLTNKNDIERTREMEVYCKFEKNEINTFN